MQMRKVLCSPSFAYDSAHVKYGVRTGHKKAKNNLHNAETPRVSLVTSFKVAFPNFP